MEPLGVPRTPESFTDCRWVTIEAIGACNAMVDACAGRSGALAALMTVHEFSIIYMQSIASGIVTRVHNRTYSPRICNWQPFVTKHLS
jgi:hypothetical protein